MSLFDIIYTIIIGPLRLLFEVIYTLAYYMCSSPGLSIIALSLVMNFLVLPLYAKADKMQEEQNNIEKKLKKGVDHIKKTFKGDERYMMLQTYYRQNNYKPTDALKGSISLLLEIPFFMAAYAFLSNLNVIKHASFGPISDLGSPDQMLNIFGITLNVLPILMTLINIIASYIYTKGAPFKAKLQLYVMAALFLVLLYDSPSGLVFYWTLNNLFSLVKNIFYKLKNPKLVLSILSSLVSLLGLLFILIKHSFTFNQTILVVAILICMQLPTLAYFLKDKITFKKKEEKPVDSKMFILSTIVLTLLLGLLIPSQLINSSPTEFINTVTMENPLIYILSSFCLAFGTFIVWCNIFYNLLGGNKVKKVLNYIFVVIIIVFIIDYMVFGSNTGHISLSLQFSNALISELKDQLINLIVIFIAILILTIIYVFKKDVIRFISIAGIITMIVVSSLNIISINKVINNYRNSLNEDTNSEEMVINLSKDSQNVVVVILDRAIGQFVPYIFEEIPGLQEQYAGFTFYPNTLSFGKYTKFGIPSLFGGYEYTPAEIDKRENETLQSKIYEAFKVMPAIFSDNGYDVTIIDPMLDAPLSIYDDLKNTKVFNTIGKINLDEYEGLTDNRYERLKRNVFCYSIVKCVPMAFQQIVYNFGAYNDIDYYQEIIEESYSIGKGVLGSFVDNFEVLKALPNLTKVDSDSDTFTIIYNCTPHDDTILSEPDFEPKMETDNSVYDAEHYIRNTIDEVSNREMILDNSNKLHSYQVQVASLMQVGNWLDYLRKEGIYDNTRIIIVADHGHDFGIFEDDYIENTEDSIMSFNPLLMYKDFNDREFKIDNSFMTNADTPYLAVNGLIEDSINPYTGNLIECEAKNDIPLYILSSDETSGLDASSIKYTIRDERDYWLSFTGRNIFDINSYQKLDSSPAND